jgi:hypothetical protein
MPISYDDATHIGQPDAGALEFIGAVQALEHAEKLPRLIYNEPNAGVALILSIRRMSV